MQPRSDAERIQLYRESISRAWGYGDANTWPVKLNAAFHLFLKEFGEELIADIIHLEAEGKSLAEIAQPFYNPARLYRIIDSTIYSMRRNRYNVADQRAIVQKLLAMTRALKHGSEFNEDGANRIYSPAEQQRIAERRLSSAVDSPATSQIVHRFCGVMWAYTEAIFFRAHDVTKEIHGPYTLDDDRQFIVQEYLNLRPAELWPGFPLLPCRTIRVYKQYSRSVRISIDALNHLYHEGGQLVPSLTAYSVEVDGEEHDVGILNEYLKIVQQTVMAISRHIDSISWNERVLKYSDIFWFRKKPLRDQRGLDWRVPASVRSAILAGHENERRRTPLSNEASARLAMLTI
ncbi:MAG TPA: hypothetical protein VI260_15590 [Blastocatellia bacterium]|jgi:hypothetical protein